MPSAETRPYEKECKEALLAVAKELEPVFSQLGYSFSLEDTGVSSGGPFANGFFHGPVCRVGLIWRAGSGLGGVSYEAGKTVCGHDELLAELGVAKAAWFTFDEKKWAPRAKKGHTLTESLAHDVSVFLAEILTTKGKGFLSLARKARERTLVKMFGEKGRDLAHGS
jgi:hypothetical protein